MTHIFSQQPDLRIHLVALKRDGKDRACFSFLLEAPGLWNLSCSLFIPGRVDCFSLVCAPTFTSVIISLASFGVIFPLASLAWNLKWGHLDSNMLPHAFYSNYPLPKSNPGNASSHHLNISGNFWRCLSHVFMKVVSQLSDDNQQIPSPLRSRTRKPYCPTDRSHSPWLLCLAHFTGHNVFKVHPYCVLCQNFLLFKAE